MRNTSNMNIYKSTSSDITDWKSIDWNKIEKYVDKQQKQIYKADVENRKNVMLEIFKK